MNVKTLKLITGEVLVAEITGESEDEIVVNNPVIFNYAVGTYIPYDEMFEEYEFPIETKNIMRMKGMSEDNIKGYQKAIAHYEEERIKARSGIVTPDKQIVT